MRRLEYLLKRIAKMEPEGCPYCQAWAAIPEAEKKERLGACVDALVAGKPRVALWTLPEPSPTCPECGQVAAMNPVELDARLSRLIGRLRERREAAGPIPAHHKAG
ncbi:MAG: hypothetical protein WCP70_04270 [Methanothrix sp.]